jgi:hypothetical protein
MFRHAELTTHTIYVPLAPSKIQVARLTDCTNVYAQPELLRRFIRALCSRADGQASAVRAGMGTIKCEHRSCSRG